MRTGKLILSVISITMLLSVTNIFAQEKGHDKGHEMSAMEKAWMAYMTPGEQHEHFKVQASDWTYVSKFWMDPTSKEPMVTNGTAKFETIFGGRYLKMTHDGEMMGMPFHGFGLSGYDNAKKVYQSIWIDNMGTGIMYMTGNYIDGKLVMTGTAPDPMTGKDVTMKEVNTEVDKDHFYFEMYVVTPKGDVKTMEINYTRVK